MQKEYRKQIYRTAWLPASVRMKYGRTTGTVAATSVPNQTSSSTGRVNVSNYCFYDYYYAYYYYYNNNYYSTTKIIRWF